MPAPVVSVVRALFGVEITRDRRARLHPFAAQFLLGIIGVALITYVCFWAGFGLGRTSLAYVILIALVSLLGSFSISVVLSIIAVACLNYFFVPPLFEFRLDDGDDIVRMAAFFTTSLVVTGLLARLRTSEARFRTFVDHAMDAFVLLDSQLTVLDVNRQACVSLGYSREELIGMQPRDIDAELDEPSMQRIRERILTGETVSFETRHRRKDGTSFPVEIRVGQFEQGGRRLLCLVRDITERKRAEDELRASEARFRTFVDHATDGFFLFDFDEHQPLLDVNRQACESLGYGREEMIGMHPRDFDAHLDAASIAWLGERVTRGETVTFETLHRRKDGTVFPVEVRARQFEQSGRRLLCLVRDITERKRAEDELRASEVRFRSFVDHATDGFYLFDESQALLDVNRQACESLGYARQEMIGMHPLDFDVGLEPASIARIGERVANGETVTFETLHRRKDGTVFPVEVRARQFEHGAHRFRLSLARDITERKRAEDVLRESEERFRTLVQLSFDVYWESDAQHRFTRQENAQGSADAPEPGSETDRYRDFATLRGKTRWEVPYLEPDAEGMRKHRETLDAHLPFRDFEVARRTPDGGRRYVSVSGLPVFDKSGRFVGYRGVGRHITERKRAEEALRRSEAYLTEAQRLSHTGTVVFNAAGPIYWSEENYRIWGLDPVEGLPLRDAVLQRIHPDDRESVDAETEDAVREKRDFMREFRIVLPDGAVKHIRSVGRPFFSADGELVEMVATTVDVTERKRAQEEHERLGQLEVELTHVNRVSIMGEFAASLAHEILHPIATARNNARAGMRFLELAPPNLGEVKEALACVVKDADRAKDIVARMRDHIKKAPPRIQLFDLNEAVDEVIVMVRDAMNRSRVSLRTRLGEGIPQVRCDRVQLQQVLMNLMLNAIEAMSLGAGARELSISTNQGQTSEILVAVQDSGPGIDPERLERIFEPFYTTKSTGTGMGLSICRSIINAHGGRLWAEANRPRGAIFQFTLPAGRENS